LRRVTGQQLVLARFFSGKALALLRHVALSG
jgi:hypothetical protein